MLIEIPTRPSIRETQSLLGIQLPRGDKVGEETIKRHQAGAIKRGAHPILRNLPPGAKVHRNQGIRGQILRAARGKEKLISPRDYCRPGDRCSRGQPLAIHHMLEGPQIGKAPCLPFSTQRLERHREILKILRHKWRERLDQPLIGSIQQVMLRQDHEIWKDRGGNRDSSPKQVIGTASPLSLLKRQIDLHIPMMCSTERFDLTLQEVSLHRSQLIEGPDSQGQPTAGRRERGRRGRRGSCSGPCLNHGRLGRQSQHKLLTPRRTPHQQRQQQQEGSSSHPLRDLE